MSSIDTFRRIRALVFCGGMVIGCLSAAVQAAPATSILDTDAVGATVDGVISDNEYGEFNRYQFRGAGSGFGGTLGNGALYFQSTSSSLFVGFKPGAAVNDNVVIHLDTRAGGFTDAQMNDTADGGRNLSSNLTRDVNDVFPAEALPDYSLVIGGFGIVLFELNAGDSPNHLNFVQFSDAFQGNDANLAREIEIPLSSLGNPSTINFFASYGSDTNFLSDETVPAEPYNGQGNPGFGGAGDVSHENYDQFIVVAPEPGALGLIATASFGFLRRRRR